MADGGGGDGDSRRVAQEDEAKKARSRNALNVLFGIAPGEEAIKAEQMPEANAWHPRPQAGDPVSGRDQKQGTTDMTGWHAPTDTTGPGRTWGGQVPAPVAPPEPVAPPPDPRIAEAEKNKGARTADYQKIFDDVLGLNKENVMRDRGVAARMNKFQIFRQGLQTGSTDIEQQGQLKEVTDRAMLDAANRASGARTGAQSTDEGARLDLLRQISGGLDAGSAATSAVRGMDLARQNAYDTAKGNLVEGAFDSAGLLYQADQQGQSMRRGRELYQRLAGARTPGGADYYGK